MAAGRTGGLKRYYNLNGWLFIAPAIALISIFLVYPIFRSLYLSFFTGKGMMMKFGGTANVIRLWNDPVFFQALKNTVTFFVVQVPIMILLALMLASVLNNDRLKFIGFFRTAIFLPCVASLVAYSVLFKSMFSVDGVVNQALMAIGLVGSPIGWLTEPFWAKLLVILAITWRWTGYNMIFYLAALQNIDKSIYEAARIDGVPAWARFFYITIPMLKPVILFTTIISTIGTIQLFDEVYNLTEGRGSPANSTLTLSLYIYNLTFRFMPSFGYAATLSYVVVLMVALFSFLQFYAVRDRS
ncbi:lactose/L-arabinose transport system permease protein [Pararhizobium capsulatum DSM 1112]|uniref:Lactose/L-arabinose transport system permease protein n=1 Tax=Pararhizobium capsulatum DSM 1112 TaxID=1121113 RepID=A0ABU0BXN9_9HYPH|nr:sugar ABC transporter permease [Pararhizobium capsulatum]MDQ0322697.1 lactose/L-arabinose transport system permease protein [Pararhizobium capsulatum DSM 1112]